jgi:hypothetical protein
MLPHPLLRGQRAGALAREGAQQVVVFARGPPPPLPRAPPPRSEGVAVPAGGVGLEGRGSRLPLRSKGSSTRVQRIWRITTASASGASPPPAHLAHHHRQRIWRITTDKCRGRETTARALAAQGQQQAPTAPTDFRSGHSHALAPRGRGARQRGWGLVRGVLQEAAKPLSSLGVLARKPTRNWETRRGEPAGYHRQGSRTWAFHSASPWKTVARDFTRRAPSVAEEGGGGVAGRHRGVGVGRSVGAGSRSHDL